MQMLMTNGELAPECSLWLGRAEVCMHGRFYWMRCSFIPA